MSDIIDKIKAELNKENAKSPSPVFLWLKGIYREIDSGSAVVDYKIREDMCNPIGMIHGGTLAMIADETIGIAVVSLGLKEHFVTVDLNLNYLSGAKLGEIITAKSKVIRQGRKIIFTECEIFNAQGKLLIKSTSNLVVTDIKKNY